MAGFWKAPRVLFRMLAERDLAPSEWALLNVVGEGGGDRPDGFVTTNGFLATVLDINERTVRRGLRGLRARGLLSYDDHPGTAAFNVRTTAALAALCEADLGHTSDTPRTFDPPPMSEVRSDMPATATGRNAAPAEGSAAVTTSDISRARAETETETDNHLTTFGGAAAASREHALRSDHPPAQALVAYYVDLQRELGVDAPKRLIGQTAGQVGELLREGQPAQVVARALELLVERRLHPSTLPSLIPEAVAGPGKRAEREHPIDAFVRESFEGPDR